MVVGGLNRDHSMASNRIEIALFSPPALENGFRGFHPAEIAKSTRKSERPSTVLTVPRDFPSRLPFLRLSRVFPPWRGCSTTGTKHGERVWTCIFTDTENKYRNTRLPGAGCVIIVVTCYRYLLEGQRPRWSACFLPRGSGILSATAEWSPLR